LCAGRGHSPTVAARFYAQARTEVLERASVESTLPGAPAGARPAEKDVFDTKAGANAGAITDRQDGLRATVWRGENQQKEPSEDSPDGSCKDADGVHQWAKREVIKNNIEPYIELDLKSGFLLGFYTDSVDEKLLQMAEIWGLISDADKDFILSFMERIRSQKL
jgi:hypothetical protein